MKNNTGVLIRDPQPTDWIASAETGITFEERMPTGDWSKYLPADEWQKGLFDTMACVSFSALNCVEAQVNYLVKEGKIGDQEKKELEALGFFRDGLFNCSDRFTAKMSGTTPSGNYLTAVWDSIRHHGILPESDWAFDLDRFQWNNYYSEIPQSLKDKAKKILDILDFNYEFVVANNADYQERLVKHLKQAPLQLAAPICPNWASKDTVIATCGLTQAQHATMNYGFMCLSSFDILDHYDPFKKKVVWSYPIPFAMKGLVKVKQAMEAPKPFSHYFMQALWLGMRSAEVAILQDALKRDGTFPLNVNSTGYFGTITRQAVMAFQRKHKVADEAEIVAANGRVGNKTLAKLNEMFNNWDSIRHHGILSESDWAFDLDRFH